MKKDDLGNRIKRYQGAYDFAFTDKTPIIVRLDGRSFHNWVKKSKCKKPFDLNMSNLMADTTKFLCQNVSGCVFGYTQSDEISLCLINSQTIETQPWFDNRIQKIVSVVSSLATCYFNLNNNMQVKVPAIFDCRAFVIPQKQIINYFIWRQRDAIRNSISMLSHTFFSVKQLHKKNSAQQLQMLKSIYIKWQDYPERFKKGIMVYKIYQLATNETQLTNLGIRKHFSIDDNINLFVYQQDCIINKILMENNIKIF